MKKLLQGLWKVLLAIFVRNLQIMFALIEKNIVFFYLKNLEYESVNNVWHIGVFANFAYPFGF